MDIGSMFGNVVIGAAIAVGIGIAMARQRKQNAALAPSIDAELGARGPQTLPVLATALGMGGFFARGKVALALNELATSGRGEIIAAPEGTPQLEKVNHIRYRLRDG